MNNVKETSVVANGVKLECLEWGSTKRRSLILIHGLADNPHIFEDLAPAFADRFRVIAYARRGAGRSEAKPPYDMLTLTDDVIALMDSLRLAKADLVGWSFGGNEVTAVATRHPERVGRIVYLDGAYDFADPEFVVAFRAMPAVIAEVPGRAMSSLEAYRAYKYAVEYTDLEDKGRVERYLEESVSREADGRLRPRIARDVMDQLIATLLTERRDYGGICCPALAIYPQWFLNPRAADPDVRRAALAWESTYMVPFRRRSMERVRCELPHAEIRKVPGTHESFFLVFREEVVSAMRQFLDASES